MSWRDNLVPASFRGVPFKVSTSNRSFGRKTAIQQYDGYDTVNIQDLGRDSRDFELQGYVIQNSDNDFDYFEERNALISALEAYGPGTLVHPFYGNKQVQMVGKCSLEETFDQGGIARFTMKFVETKELKPPTIAKSATEAVDQSVESMLADAADANAARTVPQRPFIDSLLTAIQGGLQSMNKALRGVRGAIGDAQAYYSGQVSSIISGLDQIIDTPCDVFSSVSSAGNGFAGICGLLGEVVSGGVVGACSGTVRGDVTELDGTSVPETLGTSCLEQIVTTVDSIEETGFIPAAQLANVFSGNDSMKAVLLGQAARIAVRIDWSSQETLNTYLTLLQDCFDAFLLRLGQEVDETNYDYVSGNFIDNTLLYNSIENVRNQLVSEMLNLAEGSAKTIDYSVSVDIQSCLELAYDKYQDLDRLDDLFLRNKGIMNHPGFLPAGETMRILDE